MNRNDIKKVLSVPLERKWDDCNNAIQLALFDDDKIDYMPEIKDLLNANYKVLIYSGDQDFICNWRGGENWTSKQKWYGQEDFEEADYEEWYVSGKASG
jgi:cathepsin A (carboxypeptidase C)